MKRGRAFTSIGELAWYLAGSDRTDFVSKYITKYLELDVDGRIPSAYGPRLFGTGIDSQIENLVQLLKDHPSSRRAVAQIFDRTDLPGEPKEVPCTCSLQFLLRDGRLDAVVHMRSNDAYLGLPHDIFAFTMIQEVMASALGAQLGHYVHMVSSLHLYEKNVRSVRMFLDEGRQTQLSMPAMPATDPWDGIKDFLTMERSAREGNADFNSWSAGYWTDMGLMCAAHLSSDAAEVSHLRSKLSEDYFRLYMTDLAYEREATGEVVA